MPDPMVPEPMTVIFSNMMMFLRCIFLNYFVILLF